MTIQVDVWCGELMEAEMPKRITGDMVGKAYKANPPKTQYDCCLLGARLSVRSGNVPMSDADFIDAAYAMARGLFGPAFINADYGQRTAWIDMCERAYREAVSEI